LQESNKFQASCLDCEMVDVRWKETEQMKDQGFFPADATQAAPQMSRNTKTFCEKSAVHENRKSKTTNNYMSIWQACNFAI